MKKRVLLVAAIFTATFGMAQDLTSKKGETILPEAGDYAIGFDAAPFLDYFGNLFNTGTNNAFTAGFAQGQSITGKMFTDANNAYRFGVRLGLNNKTTTDLVDDLSANADAGDKVENEMKESAFNVALSLGKEMRRGNTRLQGFYGAEAMLAFGSKNTETTFGNDIEDVYNDNNANDNRDLSVKEGSTFGIGARGFVGVEYFVAPKISVAAEYGWGLMLNTTGAGETVNESYDGTDSDENTIETGKESTFSIDTDNAAMNSVNIRMMFHF